MYERFFGFRERPFDLTPNPRFLVLTEAHREALSNLEYGIASGKGMTLLIGEAGCGKTTVIRTALERQPARVHSVYISNPALTRAEFIELLGRRFELDDAARASKTTLLAELERILKARRSAGETTVLIIDEAQSLSLEILEEIRLLANIETDDEKLLLVILAGQPEFAERLNALSLRQLKQRIALRCELRPLTLQETAAYLSGRIQAAGGVGAQVFTREAVTRIYESARGIPRVISVIADNALLNAFARGCRPVSSDVILEVCRDFDLAARDVVEASEFASEKSTDAPGAAAITRVVDVGGTVVGHGPGSSGVPVQSARAAVENENGEDPVTSIWRSSFLRRAPGQSPVSLWRRFLLEKRSVQR